MFCNSPAIAMIHYEIVSESESAHERDSFCFGCAIFKSFIRILYPIVMIQFLQLSILTVKEVFLAVIIPLIHTGY